MANSSSGPNLRIVISGDAKQALEQIKGVEQALSGLAKPVKDPTKEVVKGFQNVTVEIREAKKEVSSFNEFMSQMGGKLAAVLGITAVANFAKNTVDAAARAEGAFKGLESVANRTGIGIQRAWADAEKISADGLMSQTEAATALKNLYARGFSADEAVQMLTRIKDAAAFDSQGALEFGQAVVSATEGLKNENSVLVDNAGITKNVSKMWESYAKSIGKTTNELTMAEKRQAEFNGIMEETEAQAGNTAKKLEGYSGQATQLSQKTEELKSKIGEALTPAFTMLATAASAVVDNGLKPIMEYLQKLGARIAQFAANASSAFRNMRSGSVAQYQAEVAQNEAIYQQVSKEIEDKLYSKGPAIAKGSKDNIDKDAVAKRAQREAEEAKRAQEKIDKDKKEADDKRNREAQREARRARDAQQAEAEAAIDSRLSSLKTGVDAELSLMEESYAKQLISQQDYIDRKAALEKQTLDAERAAIAERIALMEQLAEKAKGDPDEQAKYRADVQRLNTELEAIKAKGLQLDAQIRVDQYQAQRALDDLQLELRVKLLDLQGNTLEARLAQIKAETERALQDPTVQGSPEAQGRIREIGRLSEQRARYDDAQTSIGRTREGLDLRTSQLSEQLATGQIDQAEHDRALRDAKNEAADAIERYTVVMEEAAAATGDQGMALGVRKVIGELTELRSAADEVTTSMKKSLAEGIVGALNAVITGTKNAKDAMRSMAADMIAQLAKIAQQQLISMIFKSLSNSAGGGWVGSVMSLFGSVAASTGGIIRGPGTGTSDSIPARLSNGEGVLRAAAMKKLGAETFHYLNRTGELPPRFAEGGIAGATPIGSGGGGSESQVNVKVVNVLDPSVVESAFAGSAFEKQVMNVISKNPAGVRQATGG